MAVRIFNSILSGLRAAEADNIAAAKAKAEIEGRYGLNIQQNLSNAYNAATLGNNITASDNATVLNTQSLTEALAGAQGRFNRIISENLTSQDALDAYNQLREKVREVALLAGRNQLKTAELLALQGLIDRGIQEKDIVSGEYKARAQELLRYANIIQMQNSQITTQTNSNILEVRRQEADKLERQAQAAGLANDAYVTQLKTSIANGNINLALAQERLKEYKNVVKATSIPSVSVPPYTNKP